MGAMAGRFDNLNYEQPFVVEADGVRSLHFTIGELQSSMRLDRPQALEVDYTRTMMGFLLLNPVPGHVAMIGLGGGSLAKFCHAHLPSVRVTAVENNLAVIELRREFGVPEDGARFHVIADDGADFVGTRVRDIDVLLVDGFDHRGQPPRLCSQTFYDDCFRALATGGVLVVNLHADDADHPQYIARIANSFGGNAMKVMAPGKYNCIVFAAKGLPVTLDALRDIGWASVLGANVQRELRGEFAHIGWNAVGMSSG